MTDAELHDRLRALAAGDSSALASVREAMAACGFDPGLLEAPEDAGQLLELLQEGPPLLAGMALDVDVSDLVMKRLFGAQPELPIGDAVRAAAGTLDGADRRWAGVERHVGDAVRAAAGVVDVWPAVARGVGVDEAPARELWLSALLDNELRGHTRERAVAWLASEPAAGPEMTRLADVGRVVREAVVREAGPAPSVWSGVGPAIGVSDPEQVPGWDGAWFAASLRAAAGPIDVADAVMAGIRVDLAPAPELPEPVNTVHMPAPWSVVSAVALAAGLLVAVFWRGAAPEVREVALPAVEMEFAAAGEVNVDRIHTGPEASVFVEVPTGKDAPLIIWVDDPGGG